MSAKLVTAVLTSPVELDTLDVLVMVIIANACNARKDDGIAWPSVATIASAARVRDRQVRRSLAKLFNLGVLEAVSSRRGGRTAAGVGLTTVYRVRADVLACPVTRDRVKPVADDRVNPVTEGAEPCHARSPTLSPMTVKQEVIGRTGTASVKSQRDIEQESRRQLAALAALAANLTVKSDTH